ncbi:hypothetical protein VTN02DRAFT_721 [Thermoascus thermophilus]
MSALQTGFGPNRYHVLGGISLESQSRTDKTAFQPFRGGGLWDSRLVRESYSSHTGPERGSLAASRFMDYSPTATDTQYDASANRFPSVVHSCPHHPGPMNCHCPDRPSCHWKNL